MSTLYSYHFLQFSLSPSQPLLCPATYSLLRFVTLFPIILIVLHTYVWVIYGSRAVLYNLSGHWALKKLNSPSLSTQWLPEVGVCELYPHQCHILAGLVFVGLLRAAILLRFLWVQNPCHVQEMLSCSQCLDPWTLTVFPPPLALCSLSLRCSSCVTDVPFKAAPPWLLVSAF